MSINELLASLGLDDAPPGYRLVVEIDVALRGLPGRESRAGWLGPWQHPPRSERRRMQSSGFVARSEYPTPPGNWVDDAACKGRRMYYSIVSAHVNQISREDRAFEQQAIALCESCPVLEQCRDWALQDIDPAVDHIAGGLTPRQRRDMRRQGCHQAK